MTSVIEPLWEPTVEQVAAANITRFAREAENHWGRVFDDYSQLHRWSVDEPEEFWNSIWDFCGLIAAVRGERVVDLSVDKPGARFFPDARFNFACNLLQRRDKADAIVFWSEDKVRRRLSYSDLYLQTAGIALALRNAGIKPGDRVCGFMPNMPETVIAMLAATSIGAVWSSCSPDFGVSGVVDRFGQIEPRILFSSDGYYYNGKWHDSLSKLAKIREGLPSIEHVVIAPFVESEIAIDTVQDSVYWKDFFSIASDIEFVDLPFNHPIYILYSSGTTGIPKCIVHGAGGTILQHLKEQRLHVNLSPDDRFFYFTTCGWMMWNWLVSGLATGSTLILYDGSPFYPNGKVLFDLAEEEKIQIFGTSAKFLDAAAKAEICPMKTHDLAPMRTLLSTGSPLMPESFDFVYQSIKKEVCLSSISGGTDLVACFVGGNPILPVWKGEIQCPILGMKVEVRGDDGDILSVDEKGELTCSNLFPSMPIGFWNDKNSDRYQAAYFEKFPGVWCHGDYVAETIHGGMIVYGRSDATLNPGGVRIGTAEIYRQAEQIPEVLESLVVGQSWEGDTRIVLFVCLREGLTLTASLCNRICSRIRQNTTPRHVPDRVVQVNDIPRTKSGKIVELAVKQAIEGLPVKNREALANPEALDQFSNLHELKT
jgi:acetoacetyl-CoA synthetase